MYKEINNCITTLKKGGVILYPTDTIWGIGCDATNKKAVEKIKKIKKRQDDKSFIVLVDTLSQLRNITKKNYNIKNDSKKPTTIIYPKVYGIANNILANDGSCGIRVVKDIFCQKLIKKFGVPITSTSANISGNKNPKNFSEVDIHILNNVDYIVNLRREEFMENPSRIIKINNLDKIEIIREWIYKTN